MVCAWCMLTCILARKIAASRGNASASIKSCMHQDERHSMLIMTGMGTGSGSSPEPARLLDPAFILLNTDNRSTAARTSWTCVQNRQGVLPAVRVCALSVRPLWGQGQQACRGPPPHPRSPPPPQPAQTPQQAPPDQPKPCERAKGRSKPGGPHHSIGSSVWGMITSHACEGGECRCSWTRS